MSTSRIHYIDIAKGIGILVVILGHTAIGINIFLGGFEKLIGFIFSFHMPLFFIVSGFFIRPHARYQLSKELRRLILPYIITALTVAALQTAYECIFRETGLGGRETLARWLSAAAFGAGNLYDNELFPQYARIGAIWFLLALFWARLIVVQAQKSRYAILLVLGFCALGLISKTFVTLPWSIQSGFVATPFVYLGSKLTSSQFFTKEEISPPKWVLLAVIWICCFNSADHLWMNDCYFGSSVQTAINNILVSIAGSLVVIKLSRLIEEHAVAASRLLEPLGRLSLILLCVHLVEDDVVRWHEPVMVWNTNYGPLISLVIWFVVRLVLDVVITFIIETFIRNVKVLRASSTDTARQKERNDAVTEQVA